MRSIVVLLMCVGCAYGAPDFTPVYGHKAPNTDDGGLAAVDDPSADPANDPMTTGCFVQNIWDNGTANPPSSYIVICDGQPFNVKDLIDPAPSDKNAK